jgi:hypothetical protein
LVEHVHAAQDQRWVSVARERLLEGCGFSDQHQPEVASVAHAQFDSLAEGPEAIAEHALAARRGIGTGLGADVPWLHRNRIPILDGQFETIKFSDGIMVLDSPNVSQHLRVDRDAVEAEIKLGGVRASLDS